MQVLRKALYSLFFMVTPLEAFGIGSSTCQLRASCSMTGRAAVERPCTTEMPWRLRAATRSALMLEEQSIEKEKDESACGVIIKASLNAGGLGMFAQQCYTVGDVIIREAPLVVLQDHLVESVGAEYLEQIFSTLAISSALAARNLSDSFALLSGKPSLMGMVASNCIPVGNKSTALFASICRINHSCRPNARFIWREDLGQELVVALRPIFLAEEITVSYRGESYLPSARRRALLKENFNFECGCSACKAATSLSDARVSQIQRQIDGMPAMAAGSLAKALAACENTLQLMREEGLDTPADLGKIHYDAFQVAMGLGERSTAKEHLLLAHRCASLAQGRTPSHSSLSHLARAPMPLLGHLWRGAEASDP